MVDHNTGNASASAPDASSPAPHRARPRHAPAASTDADASAMDLSMEDAADSSTASLAQRVLVRNAVEGSSKNVPSSGPAPSAAAAAAAGGGPMRRASTRHSPVPRRPGAVSWKDLTSTFKLGPNASVQGPSASAFASAPPTVTTVVSSSAASALDSFASATGPTGSAPSLHGIAPGADFSSPPATGSTSSSAGVTTAGPSSARGSAAAAAAGEGSRGSSPSGAVNMVRTSSSGTGNSAGAAPNGYAPPARLHPNAAYATEVLGPPPRLPLDPYYPPLVTAYTAGAAGVASAPKPLASTQTPINAQGENNSSSSAATGPAVAAAAGSDEGPGAAPAAAPTAASRSKKPLLTINQGSDVGHGAGPAVLPGAVAQALGTVAGKRRKNKTQKAFAASTAPRTTRARSMLDSASASPSPSLPTIGLATLPASSMPGTAGGADAVSTPPLTPSHSSAPGSKSSLLGLDVTSADASSDTDSVQDGAMAPASSGSVPAAAPEPKKRKITARLSRPPPSASSPALTEIGLPALPPTGSAASGSSTGTSAAAGANAQPPKSTIADDLDAIFSSGRRTRSTAHQAESAVERAPGSSSDLSSIASTLTSVSSSQDASASMASSSASSNLTAPPALSSNDAGPCTSAAGAPAPNGGITTPVKRPRITVKRNGVLAPPPPSVLAAAAAAAAAAGSGRSNPSTSSSSAPTDLNPAPGPASIAPGSLSAPIATAGARRNQTPPVRAESPLISTRSRRSTGGPSLGTSSALSAGPSTLASATSIPSSLGIGSSSSSLVGSAAFSAPGTIAAGGVLTRASTPAATGPLATTAAMTAYPTIGAAAHMSGSPQKAAETVGVGMTANGTLAIAPAAEFAAAAAAGGHLSAVQGPAVAGASRAIVPMGEKQANQDFCDACKGHGRFLCCDGCVRSFHFSCISPPVDMDEVMDMDDAWYCNVCRSAKRPAGKEPKGIFPRLLRQLEQTNPVQYELPADIRNYFKGVGTALDGSYLNVGMIKPLRVNKQGLIEDRDPYKLKDKNGKAVLCFHCGGSALPPVPHAGDLMKATIAQHTASAEKASALSQTPPVPTPDGNWRRILSCDFCTAHWHLDCVTPPMAVMPNMTRKWMCPNHAEHAMTKYRVPKSSTGIQPYALPLPSSDNIGKGKLYKVRLRNNGDVDIIPDPTDSFFNTDGTTNSATQPGWEELIVGGMNPNGSGQRFRYRVPEKVVRLDFWNRVKANAQPLAVRFGKPTREIDPILSLDDLADVAMERLKKERVLESVSAQGTEANREAVKLVSKVFRGDDDEQEDFPPVRSQRAYEEAIERARIHGVIGLEGGILLSKLADAPTVSERSTVGLVDRDDGVTRKGVEGALGLDVKPEESGDVSMLAADASTSDAKDAKEPQAGPSGASTLGAASDPRLLAPPAPARLGSHAPRNRPLDELRASEFSGGAAGGYDSDAGMSSPASTLTDLSSDDGHLSDDEAGGVAGGNSAGAGTLAAHGLKEGDVERLLAIERLIRVKGEAALLEFLLAKD